MKIKMLLDTKGERGGSLFSPNTYTVNCKFGKKLIKKGRAMEYNELEHAKRMVNLDGKEMTWSAYLKRRNQIYKTGG